MIVYFELILYLIFLFSVCREGLETLSVVLALYPPALETLTKDTQFHKLVMGLVLVGGERSIRQCAVEQLLLMATKCSNSPHTLVVFIVMLFNVLNGLNSEYSKEYFQVCTKIPLCLDMWVYSVTYNMYL